MAVIVMTLSSRPLLLLPRRELCCESVTRRRHSSLHNCSHRCGYCPHAAIVVAVIVVTASSRPVSSWSPRCYGQCRRGCCCILWQPAWKGGPQRERIRQGCDRRILHWFEMRWGKVWGKGKEKKLIYYHHLPSPLVLMPMATSRRRLQQE